MNNFSVCVLLLAILSINNIPVQKIKDLEIVSGKNDSELVMHVQRNNRTAFILLK